MAFICVVIIVFSWKWLCVNKACLISSDFNQVLSETTWSVPNIKSEYIFCLQINHGGRHGHRAGRSFCRTRTEDSEWILRYPGWLISISFTPISFFKTVSRTIQIYFIKLMIITNFIQSIHIPHANKFEHKRTDSLLTNAFFSRVSLEVSCSGRAWPMAVLTRKYFIFPLSSLAFLC